MKRLEVHRIRDRHAPGGGWREAMADLPRHPLDEAPWERQFPYRPEVSFAVGWCGDGLCLDFRVREAHVRAVATEPNGRVWEDSCVECFVGLAEGEAHYAFEFSCIGVPLAAFHDQAGRRTWLPPEALAAIEINPSLPRGVPLDRQGDLSWSLAAFIPFEAFAGHAERIRDSRVLPANFYKCGDRLDRPHYLCWNPVAWERPSFHRPACFGELRRV